MTAEELHSDCQQFVALLLQLRYNRLLFLIEDQEEQV